MSHTRTHTRTHAHTHTHTDFLDKRNFKKPGVHQSNGLKIAYKIAITTPIDKIFTVETFCCYFQAVKSIYLHLRYVTNDNRCITSYPPSVLGYD